MKFELFFNIFLPSFYSSLRSDPHITPLFSSPPLPSNPLSYFICHLFFITFNPFFLLFSCFLLSASLVIQYFLSLYFIVIFSFPVGTKRLQIYNLLKIIFFWDATSCRLVDVSEVLTTSIFRPEDGGSRFVRNIGKYPVKLYGLSLQKITNFTVRTMKLANPALWLTKAPLPLTLIFQLILFLNSSVYILTKYPVYIKPSSGRYFSTAKWTARDVQHCLIT